MPDPNPPSDRTPAERQADHEGLARLATSLVPALVQKLNGSALGELEVREGPWRIRLRRPQAASHARRERPARPGHAVGAIAGRQVASAPVVPASTTRPSVSGRRTTAARWPPRPRSASSSRRASRGDAVRAGDRIAVVDLLGVAQEVVAPIDGVLGEVLAETGEAVEYGEELVVLEPSLEVDATDGTDAGDGTGGDA